MGCNIELHARDQALQRMVPRENMAINNEWLCDFGRFDTLPIGTERLRQPLLDGQATTWAEALRAAADCLRSPSLEVVASPSITNEALNALRSIAAGLKARLSVWPSKTGRTRGSIQDLLASKTIVLLDFDVWQQLPVLALRIREALRAGAKLYFVGAGPNGLARDTAGTYASVRELVSILEPSPSGRGQGEGSPSSGLQSPISILGPGADDLAERLEATGLVGNPPTGANAFAMADLPEADFQAESLLLVGNEHWPEQVAGKSVVQMRRSPNAKFSIPNSITLPITHPYEQAGTVTNLEGRVQDLKAGGRVAGEARPDWQALIELARALGLSPVQEESQAALA